ncbi:hypothetical protein sscle_03g025280 [Sclerotinia sclerotiorum 1980 UF-70]|uniref:FR47-like domain-containing protein n=1 Tax=Sclerotinia sclerotiorum (strain ATCC 18683 / 1980 / Ss-1) TaxID=665079 RepID=A0A1D9PYG0_SCLS1|nr:hypothetical protein sscle_03g025280 [Sclerotinia sclerotiorum 1980 UF-70]
MDITLESPTSCSRTDEIQFYIHPQKTISETLIPILQRHLPYSNPIYSRMLAPQNTPSQYCLFAATFPPYGQVPEIYTIVFSDRSRKTESQIWVFNPLITLSSPQPLSQEYTSLLTIHLKGLLKFLKETIIPEAPGHPFHPILKFACLHEIITDTLGTLLQSQCQSQSTSSSIIVHHTRWNLYLIPTTLSSIPSSHDLQLPFTISRVPPKHIHLVVSTSSIPREPSTLLAQPSLCLLTTEGEMIAWAFIGIDGTFATLYVQPPYRGQGLASYIARLLVYRLGCGEFRDLGFTGESGWVHADVKEGNSGSEGVMRALEGKKGWVSSYFWADCERLDF